MINDKYDYLKQTANVFFCNLSTMNNYHQSVTVIPDPRFAQRAHICSEMAFCHSHSKKVPASEEI
jgi:hypothetical protein